MQWIAADQIFDGYTVRTGLAVRVSSGTIVEISEAPAGTQKLPGLLCPGFVDLQVNGGGGAMLNTTPTLQGIVRISEAHRKLGTTHILPTVITDAPEVMDRAADAVLAAGKVKGVLGLHIEGPHISETRRGTHAARFVRPMDTRTLNVVARLRAKGAFVMVTVAPEVVTENHISKLVDYGAVVSLGHTDADVTQMQAAMAAGATCATHLFNAMSPMLGRKPGAVGAVINSDCYNGIICDGIHVDDSMVGLAIRARPVPDRMFVVSDAMATVGGPDQFELYGKQISLDQGRLVNAEGSLAGAHVTQAEAMKRLVDNVGVPLETALKMATSTPAACIGAKGVGTLIGASVEDTLVLDNDLTLRATLADAIRTDDLNDVGT